MSQLANYADFDSAIRRFEFYDGVGDACADAGRRLIMVPFDVRESMSIAAGAKLRVRQATPSVYGPRSIRRGRPISGLAMGKPEIS